MVAEAWNQPTRVYNPFLNLHIKMQRTGRKLKQWAKSKIGNNKMLMLAAKKLISILEVVQEHRQLSEEEIHLKQDLKQKLLGFATIEKIRARQQSRLTWIRAVMHHLNYFSSLVQMVEGGKSTFRVCTQQRGRYTHINKKQGQYMTTSAQFLAPGERQQTLDWEKIGHRRMDLQHLEVPFIEDEIKGMVFEMPSEKAPGPDGFIGAFFKSCWELIKQDVLAAMMFFFNQHNQQLNLLNSGYIVLIPKHVEAKGIGDYLPIS